MDSAYAIGLDFGTNSVRALVVDVASGREAGTGVFDYPSGLQGVLLDRDRPDLARQHPGDYVQGVLRSIALAMEAATREDEAFDGGRVIGIGVDTTGSTPIPVDQAGVPLGLLDRFRDRLEAQAWLWKDHTAHAEAREITDRARTMRPEYLAKCGGVYSSEWFWAKIWHCLRVAPDVFEAAHTWVEHADWIPAMLSGTQHPDRLKRSICAAGHKAMFHADWGGYPDEEFLGSLDEGLLRVRRRLPDEAFNVSQAAGTLTSEWARRLGLPAGVPVAVGAFDAHLGAVGSGIAPGALIKIIGTSTCDLMVAPFEKDPGDIPGLCGIVPESVLPGHYGMEAGQSAVGDIFNWFVRQVRPDGKGHEALTEEAARLRPGASGLLALDWFNGNRTILVDPRLTGLIVGLTLHSTPGEIYRALIEATAFGARRIMERFEEYGVPVERIVHCGGISDKNDLVMQIYADVMGRPIMVSRSARTCALGAAVSASVAAGAAAGGHEDFPAAMRAMTGVRSHAFEPDSERRRIYDRLYALYRRLHDAFGVESAPGGAAAGGSQGPGLFDVMKALLALRDEVRA